MSVGEFLPIVIVPLSAYAEHEHNVLVVCVMDGSGASLDSVAKLNSSKMTSSGMTWSPHWGLSMFLKTVWWFENHSDLWNPMQHPRMIQSVIALMREL